MLSEISIVGNGVPFRNYVLTHNQVSLLKYERVISIQEFNGDKTKAFEPIEFNYTSYNALVVHSKTIYDISPSNISGGNSKVLTSDFTGNGVMDFILYPYEKNVLYAFWDPKAGSNLPEMGNRIETGNFSEIFPVNYLSPVSKLQSKQGFVLVKESDQSSVKFQINAAGTYATIAVVYEKLWNALISSGYYSECTKKYESGKRLSMTYIPGDFNGDGLTDVLAISLPYTQTTSEKYTLNNLSNPSSGGYCTTLTSYVDRSEVSFINLDRRVATNFASYVGNLLKSTSGKDIYTGDFNGDGKTDLLHVTIGNMYVYSLNDDNTFSLLYQQSDSRIVLKYPAYLGDYNGDGKTDVMFRYWRKYEG